MSTINDVLTVLRSRGDNPEEMEQVLMDLQKEEQAKLKDLRVTLIDQLDCPQQCKVLADYYEMLKIASLAPQTETDKPADNDWRIYLWGMARRTNKHLIEWCRDAVKDGRLPKRIDDNGLLYIYVNDLLPYKWQIVYVNGRVKRIDIYEVLQDGIIANGEIKKLAQKILAGSKDNLSDVYIQHLECGLLGYVAACNTSVMAPYLQEVGLEGWLE